MSQTYKVAIVGCGEIARAHGSAWQNIPELDLVGACDVKLEALAEFANQFDVKHTYKDVRRMLEKRQPDILVIATWPRLHLKHVLEGVRNGVKAILCEAPIAINTSQTELMMQATTKANVLLVEGFAYHYHPLTLAIKEHIRGGEIGEVRFVRATLTTGLTDATRWLVRGDMGGGAVMGLGCCCIHCIRYLVGAEPRFVWATGKFKPISDIWETLVGTLDFGDGVTGQLDCGFGWTSREAYEVVGTKGTIAVPQPWLSGEGESSFRVIRDGQSQTIVVEGMNPYGAAILDVCDALSTGRPPRLTMDDSLWNMRVIEGVHESARTGQRISIFEEPSCLRS